MKILGKPLIFAATTVALTAGALAPATPASAAAVQAGPAPTNSLINPETGGQYAEYKGRTIDLSQGWQGAEICVEQSDTSFRCYDNESDYRTAEGLAMPAEGPSTMAFKDCPGRFICLWDNRNFAGKRVQFKSLGGHYLYRVGFENRANSYFNNRTRITALIDFMTRPPQYIFTKSYNFRRDLGAWSCNRPDHAGNWNNKIDAVTLTRKTECHHSACNC